MNTSPHKVVSTFLNTKPDFTGHILVLSYAPNGRGGRKGYVKKESWFDVKAGHVISRHRGNVDVQIDIRRFQFDNGNIDIRFGVGQSPKDIEGEAKANWFRRVNARQAVIS